QRVFGGSRPAEPPFQVLRLNSQRVGPPKSEEPHKSGAPTRPNALRTHASACPRENPLAVVRGSLTKCDRVASESTVRVLLGGVESTEEYELESTTRIRRQLVGAERDGRNGGAPYSLLVDHLDLGSKCCRYEYRRLLASTTGTT